MGILTRKMEKDMELMKEQLRVDTPSDNIKKESLVTQAIKTAGLPSEIQKSMGEMLRDRLKVAASSTQEDEELKKRVSEQLKSSDLVNMGTTMQKSDNSLLSKGKSLG
jgi:hypothetical protein